MTDNTAQQSKDEQAIRELIQRWHKAVEAKDGAAIVADYLPDAFVFDAIPPYKTVGADNIRKAWESCLPFFPATFRSEHEDIEVTVSGDVAYFTALHRFVIEDQDHPAGQTRMRVTSCLRRVDGQWKVAHDHVSLPFNPMTSMVWFIKDAADLSAPDFGAEGCGNS